MLETTSMSVSEIAESVNFNSTANFIKMYKKYTNGEYTPLQYRNAFLAGYIPVTRSDDMDEYS